MDRSHVVARVGREKRIEQVLARRRILLGAALPVDAEDSLVRLLGCNAGLERAHSSKPDKLSCYSGESSSWLRGILARLVESIPFTRRRQFVFVQIAKQSVGTKIQKAQEAEEVKLVTAATIPPFIAFGK